MTTTKRTYKLPPEVLAEFEEEVAPGKRSNAVAEALREWLEEKKRQRLRAAIIEGCRDMAELDLQIDREWSPASDELWRAIDDDLWEWDEPAQTEARRERRAA